MLRYPLVSYGNILFIQIKYNILLPSLASQGEQTGKTVGADWGNRRQRAPLTGTVKILSQNPSKQSFVR